ncbi:MAG: hypothetical protein AB7I50_22160 [Vicinamibacterales bacterium]
MAGLRARMNRVDAWIAEEAQKAKWRRISRMSIEEKCEVFREMLPSIPRDHPAYALAEKVLARHDAIAGRRSK